MVLIPIPSFDCVFHGPALQPSSKIKTKSAKNFKALDFWERKKEHDLIFELG